jgi:hypothetical protein
MASYSSKFGKEKRRDPKKERESIAWVKNLFAKGTVQDMPEWYNDNRRRTYTSRQSMFVFGNENENNTLLDKTNKKMSRTPNVRASPSRKTVQLHFISCFDCFFFEIRIHRKIKERKASMTG